MKYPKVLLYLTGPSKSGKTTLVEKLFPDHVHLHSDDYISGKNIQWSRAIREVSKCGECVIVDSCVVYPPLARRARFKVSLCPTQDLLAERGCNLVARNIFYGSVSKIAKKHKFTELNVHAGMCVEDIMRELAQLATIPTLDHI
jgi:GTPase SAR1 family protein